MKLREASPCFIYGRGGEFDKSQMGIFSFYRIGNAMLSSLPEIGLILKYKDNLILNCFLIIEYVYVPI